jgi:cyclophilin family peptidyl-prolyl cis-trans isomerase
MRRTPILALVPLALLAAVTSLPAAPPAAPSEVVAFCPSQSRVHLSWRDNSNDETAWLVDRWNPDAEEGAGAWERAAGGNLPANFEVWRGADLLSAAQTIRLRVAPWKPGEDEESLNWVEAEVFRPQGPLDLFLDQIGRETPEGSAARAGEAVSFQIQVRGGTPARYLGRDLPAGLSLNQNTGLVTGTIAAPGVYRCFLGVEFNGGERFERAHFFRVLPAASTPVVAQPISLPVQNAGVRGFLELENLFADPARVRGVRIQFGSASIFVALHETATPKTVENFLGYVRRGDYNGTFVHRLDRGFIVQSGGYAPLSLSDPPTSWIGIDKLDPVQNEPGLSNVRGTIAMAKLGGTRDSATSEWFLNIDTSGTNPSNLDFQNGGFTVFGEIVGTESFQTLNEINSLAILNRGGEISGPGVPPGVAGELPVLNPADPNSFLTVSSITELEIDVLRPVQISLVSNSAPQVVAAELTGSRLFIDWRGKLGTANLLLRATNSDGKSVNFTLPIRVDDLAPPTLRLTSLRGVNPPGTLLLRGQARDTIGLGSWRYRVNKRRWTTGGRLNGKVANFSARMKGFRRGRNLLEVEALDARRNSSGIVPVRFTLR